MTLVLTRSQRRVTPQTYQFTREKLVTLIELVSVCKEQIVVWLRLTDCHEYLMRNCWERLEKSSSSLLPAVSPSLADRWTHHITTSPSRNTRGHMDMNAHIHVHARMHTYTHTYIHTHRYTHTHTRTHSRTHALTHSCTRALAHTRTRARAHAHTRTRTHAHLHTHTHSHRHTRTRTRTHSQTHTHTHPYARVRAHARTHTHTHTHTLWPGSSVEWCSRSPPLPWLHVCARSLCIIPSFHHINVCHPGLWHSNRPTSCIDRSLSSLTLFSALSTCLELLTRLVNYLV